MLAFVLALVSESSITGTQVYAQTSIYKQATSYIQYIAGDSMLSTSFRYRMAFYQGRPAYCFQPYEAMAGTFAGSGTTSAVYGESTLAAWNSWDASTKQRLQLITYYGYGHGSRTDELDYMATQEAIWDLVSPCTVYWDRVNTSHAGSMNAEVDRRKNSIISDVDNWISANQKTLNWKITDSNGNDVTNKDGSGVGTGTNISFDNANIGQTYTITDLNGNFDSSGEFTQNDFGGDAVKNGNTIKVTIDANDYNVQRTITTKCKGAEDISDVGTSMVLYASGYQNLLVRGTPSSQTTSATIKITGSNGPITFTKTGNGGGLSGAQLSLYKVNANGSNTKIDSFTSDGGGKTYTNVQPANYKVVEDKSPKGWYKSSPVTFTVNAQKDMQYFSMDDSPILYKVIKTDKTTGQPLAGVTLQLQSAYGAIIDEWVTDGNYHIIDSSLLEAGETYRIHETAVPAGYYIRSEDVTFTVSEYKPDASVLSDDGYVALTVDNTHLDYEVAKVDAETDELIAGAELQLVDSNNNVIDAWTSTTEAHKIDYTKLTLGQTYTVKETKAPAGYYLQAEITSFTVNNYLANIGVTQTVKIRDNKIKYSVLKVDENNTPVDGIELGLYSDEACTNLMESWSTTTDAHIIESIVEDGKTYYVKELQTKAGYYLNDTVLPFTISAKSEVAQLDQNIVYVTNNKIHFYVEKRDQDGNRLAGATIQIIDTTNNNVVAEFASSDQDKVEIPSECLEVGKTYKVHESGTVAGYYYPTDDAEFTVAMNWSEAKNVKQDKLTSTLTDEKIQYTVVKKDKDTGNYLAGVTLGLFENKDAVAGQDTPLIAWQTSDEPYKLSDNYTLEAGKTYYVKEIATIPGYYLSNETVAFTVPNTVYKNTVMKVEYTNKKIQWRVRKVDTSGNILTVNEAGQSFKLEIYDANGTDDTTDDDTLVCELYTNDKSYVEKGYFDVTKYTTLTGGTMYRVHEAESADGYDVAPDKYATLTYDGTSDEIEMTTLSDEPLDIHLRKVDENGNLLTTYRDKDGSNKGFILAIYNQDKLDEGATEDEALVTTIDTSTNIYRDQGYADVSKYLNYKTTYVCKEIGYPYGYYKAKDVMFTVDSLGDGDIVMVDPTIKAEFRKEDQNGDPILAEYANNGVEFQFTLYDTNGTDDTSDDTAIALISTKDAGEYGWIQIGQYLQEANHTYRIHESKISEGYKRSTEDVYITTPGYYEESEGHVTNVKVSTVVSTGE